MWFESWDAIYRILITGMVCLVALIVLLRISGKRTLTKMNAFDFIVTYAIGSTLATVITAKDLTIADGITALGVIIGVQYIIAWLEVRFDWFQKIIKSQPSILFHDSEFKTDMMRKERITTVEVLAAMRYSGYADPGQVELVLMETDGQLSVIPKREGRDSYKAIKTAKTVNPRDDL